MSPADLARALDLARAVLAGSARDDEPQQLARLVLDLVRPCADCGAPTSDACPACAAPFCHAPDCPGQEVDCCKSWVHEATRAVLAP